MFLVKNLDLKKMFCQDKYFPNFGTTEPGTRQAIQLN